MKLALAKGATSVTINVFIQNSSSTTGAGLTGLTFNTAGLTAYYVRERAAAVAITLATQTVTGAYSSGGFVEIDATNMPGWYRFDPPDAALAAGVNSVGILLKGATNMAPLPIELQLTRHEQFTSAWQTDTAQAGAAGSITFAASASAVTDFYKGGWVIITSGTGSGQGRKGTASNGTTKVVSVSPDWATTPDATSVYIYIPEGLEIVDSTNPIAADVRQYGGVAGTFASGRPEVNASHIGGTLQTAGDVFARIGAPAGVSVSADVAAVKTETASIKAKTDSLTFTVAGQVDANTQSINDVTITGNGGVTPFNV